jgi:hypothetical protein
VLCVMVSCGGTRPRRRLTGSLHQLAIRVEALQRNGLGCPRKMSREERKTVHVVIFRFFWYMVTNYLTWCIMGVETARLRGCNQGWRET